MSVFEVAVGAALRALDVTRVGARVLRHPIAGLEEINQVTRPMRARLWQHRAQQLGQQGHPDQAAQSGVDSYDDQAGDGSDLAGSPSAGDEAGLALDEPDGAGLLDLVGDAVEWVSDLW